MTVLWRFLLVVMLWPLLFTVAFAQDTYGRFELKGVLISPKGRAALINGEVAREGDRVSGAEIVSIGEKSVSLLVGSNEYTVLVGSSTLAHRRSADPGRSGYTVKRGDTLSEIAEGYTGGGITMNQVMIALFEANPQAFDGNINRIREGAVLKVPRATEIQDRSFAAATAEVLRQANAWRPQEQPAARVSAREEYGPVTRGETLSRIAANLRRADVTLNQMMMALFEANPHAFEDNINELRRGMILRVPDSNDINRWTRTSANAEVLRHAELWRSRYVRNERPARVDALMTALSPAASIGTLPRR